ncbi:MAG: MMPL family transporter [Saprospiraceae bacterium]|nr:MMPL family transporter [Saprospiraceae bacterium]
MFFRYKKPVLILFLLFTAICGYYATQLKFSFSFDQFFPKGDPDYNFYQSFIKDFETDDNFLLVGLPNAPTVFDSVFLQKVNKATVDIQDLKNVRQVRSLTNLNYPVKTPFGFMSIPALHTDQPSLYEEDKNVIFADKRLIHNLINEKGDALAITIKTIDNLGMEDSKNLINSLDSLFTANGLSERHYLGRAFFQKELVDFQTNEIRRSTIISGILITLFLFFLYRKPLPVFITLSTVGIGLLIFMGILSMMGKELTALSALFPVLMLIVGSSDVIHIYTKYSDELKNTYDKYQAMWVTIRQIGLATLITSLTTAFGFASLYTSKLASIQEFGLQCAIGVVIAYVVVLFYMIPLLLMVSQKRLIDPGHKGEFWDGILESIYNVTLHRSKLIMVIFSIFTIVMVVGIMNIKTNYSILDNLPKNSKVRSDFLYFEDNFGGFRPLEYAIISKKPGMDIESYEVMKAVNSLEEKLLTYPIVKTALSQATVYKSISRSYGGNQANAYTFPQDSSEFQMYKNLIRQSSAKEMAVMINSDRDKTRISARSRDIGADSIARFSEEMDTWINQNIDTSLISIRRTGTGLILDKNSIYVKDNLIQGLIISLILISLLMGLMLKSLRMLIIALIPNLIPLLVAGGILGFFNIDLEAGISIVFAIIFGIAVDDTIHFLAKYNLLLRDGLDKETAIYQTIKETGKAIIFTSLVLCLGFMVMVFSQNPPTFTIGILISITLFSALLCDLYLLPVLVRNWHHPKKAEPSAD